MQNRKEKSDSLSGKLMVWSDPNTPELQDPELLLPPEIKKLKTIKYQTRNAYTLE